MKKLTRILFMGLVFGLLTCALSLLTSKPVPAAPLQPSVPVTVTNTPLPITGNVSVTNAPLRVTGSLSGLITNPANNPVLVRNVNDSTDREFSGWLCETDYTYPLVCSGSFDQLHQIYVNSFTVPTTTPKGLPVTQVHESLSSMAEKLKPYGFIRIHRLVVVNISAVEEVQPLPTGEYKLRVKGGKQYLVTRKYASSAESVGRFRFWKSSECVI